jgi:hypothetical protein
MNPRKIKVPIARGSLPMKLIRKAVKKVLDKTKAAVDPVNHPKHYQGNKLEVIDIIEDFNLDFCLGNAVKYILRAGKKSDAPNRAELDLKKAAWYVNRAIDNIKE